MKALLAVFLLALSIPAQAKPMAEQTPAPWKIAGLTCGFRPFTPVGCSKGSAVCVCDEYGSCNWVWVGC